MLNDPVERAAPTANQIHTWSNEIDAQSKKLPAISEQFYFDIDCGRFFLLPERTPLYDETTKNDDDALHEKGRQNAIVNFRNFVGNENQALAISKVANQQVSYSALTKVIKTTNGPLQLQNHGGGEPIGKTLVFHTFLKSPQGNLIIRVNTEQKPEFFMPAEKTKSIELDQEKSFVNFDYDLTCHFDDDGNLSLMPGTINYNYHLEEGSSGLS